MKRSDPPDRAGRCREIHLDNASIQPTRFDSTVELERRFLCLAWLNPCRGSQIAQQVGLRRRDFLIPGHGWVYTYCNQCAETGRRPDFDQALALARRDCVEVTETDLDAILFADVVRNSECENYARGIRFASVQRIEDEARSVCRDGLRAVARGLAYEAKLHHRNQSRQCCLERSGRAVNYV